MEKMLKIFTNMYNHTMKLYSFNNPTKSINENNNKKDTEAIRKDWEEIGKDLKQYIQ